MKFHRRLDTTENWQESSHPVNEYPRSAIDAKGIKELWNNLPQRLIPEIIPEPRSPPPGRENPGLHPAKVLYPIPPHCHCYGNMPM